MAGVSAALLTVVLYAWLVQCTVTSSDSSFRKPKFATYTGASSDECTRSGHKCSLDCSQLISCINTGSSFHAAVQNCSKGQLCDPYSNSCSSSATACPKFSCSEAGVFPDLLDCAGFHVCDDNLEDSGGSCDEGYMYNITTQECDKLNDTNEGYCDKTPVPQCSNGQYGTLDGDPSIYYICSSGIPKLYQCPNKQQLNTDTFQCADASLACAYDTINYTDPNNCEQYYTCTGKGKFAVHGTCPTGQSYSPTTKQCETGNCGAV